MTISPMSFGMPPASMDSGKPSAAWHRAVNFGQAAATDSAAPAGPFDTFRSQREKAAQQPAKQKKSKLGKAALWGCGAAALSFLAGVGLVITTPLHAGFGVLPGLALIFGFPLAGLAGAAVGFFKSKLLG